LHISSDTGIVPLSVKLILAGIPRTPVPRIAGAIIYLATNPDPATNGSAWLLTDDGPVFMVPKEEFKMGVYKMIDDRKNSLLKCVLYSAFLVEKHDSIVLPKLYRIATGISSYSNAFYQVLVYLWVIPLILGGLGGMIVYKAIWPIMGPS
jgi:hypothetical protein